jgi:TPR repeat protein
MSARLVRAVLVVGSLLSLAAAAHAQGKKYALLVGVKEYDHSDLSLLKYTENDAEELAKALSEAGYDEVVVLTTSRGKKDAADAPTAANVRARLEKLSNKVKRDDLLLVGLSGHGVLWPVVDEKTNKEKDVSFFCPCDARPRSGKTLDELKKTMIPLGELFKTMDESGAGTRLILVDACRNEVKGEARNIDVDSLPSTKKGTAVLMSCKSGERAFEAEQFKHGVFFYHVIRGIKGEAKNKRGEVTWASLSEHVIDKVTEDVPVVIGKGAKQTPHKIENVEGRSPLLLPAATADALFREGMDAYLGLKGAIDDEKALKLLQQAAGKGHAVAAAQLGWMRAAGVGGARAGVFIAKKLELSDGGLVEESERDEAAGVKAIKDALPAVRKKADAGDADAQALLGAFYLAGCVVDRDDKAAVNWLRKAAEQGNPQGACGLGLAYFVLVMDDGSSKGLSEETRDAYETRFKVIYKWIHAAAKKGHAPALHLVGLAHYWGVGVKEDEAEAFKWTEQSAGKGYLPAMTKLVDVYNRGRGVPENQQKAALWLQKAADKGDVRSAYELAIRHAAGQGVKKDAAAAARWHEVAAGKGHQESMIQLGFAHAEGRGVPRDEKEAERWLDRAVEKGGADVMYDLAVRYAAGREVGKDEAKAAGWYRKAAEKGHANAAVKLAVAYAGGHGVGKDVPEAERWFDKAAEKGDSYTMAAIADLYAAGKDVSKDDAKAAQWYQKAADKGHVRSAVELGVRYANGGLGVTQDEKKALTLFTKGAESSDGTAMGWLGHFHELGKAGLPKNKDEAIKWYKKGAALGNTFSQTRLKELGADK